MKPETMMNRRILLVDDEERVLAALKAAFRKKPYEVLTAGSGKEALELLEKEPVDVVVSDERMPGMTGSELLSIIRDRYPETVRIILTGQMEFEAAIRAINDGGVYRYLTKPCSSTELMVVVESAFRAKSVATLASRLLEMAREQHVLLRDLIETVAGLHPSQLAPPVDTWPVSDNAIGPARGFDERDLDTLSRREQEILQAFAAGHRISEVAELLFISPHTVRNHLKSIFRKLDVHSQTELVSRLLAPAPGPAIE